MTDSQRIADGRLPHPPLSDIALAIVIAVGSLVLFAARPLFDDTALDQPLWSYAFPLVAGLALTFRRIRPVVTLVGIVAVVIVYLVIVDTPGPMVIPIWIALYSLASHGDRRTSIVAAATAAILVSIAALTVGPDGPTAVGLGVAILLTTIPTLIGDGVRSRRALLAETDERVRLAEQSAISQARQQVLDERVRIARELHDVVAHGIATINVQAGVAAHVIDDEPDAARHALTEIKQSSKLALAELRSMLGVLRDTDDDDIPLAPSPGICEIQALVDRFVGEISYDKSGTAPVAVDPVIALTVYRIVQESLTNVMKHAPQASVRVRLTYQSHSVVVEVDDDGGGSPPPSPPSSPPASVGAALGLIGLTERVRSVGGVFSANPRFGAGFHVIAELPYAPNGASA